LAERWRAENIRDLVCGLQATFGLVAVSAASLAGAVGILRMGSEDAHADQSEDRC
jgi:hypothetical protein